MISTINFKQVENWPTYGFLYGGNILDQQTFSILKDFDFDKHTTTDPAFPNRKSVSTITVGSIGGEIATVFDKLKQEASNFDIVESLINLSFKDSDMQINNFWTHGVKHLREIQKNVYIQFVEDEPNLYMAPHADHRDVICNIQIYVSPDIQDIGTRFYKTGNYNEFKIAPFIPNSGYFSFNTHLSIHGVHNTSNQKRKSIIISWTT
jgi:hypothetical protein